MDRAVNPHRDTCADLTPDERAAYEGILDVVRERRSVDFREYRQSTIVRRVQNRMISANEGSFPAYLHRLRSDPEETDRLLERLTIKVSGFFRHPEAFQALEAALRERHAASTEPISIWSAGCAQGEEPYSLAIVLEEIGHPRPVSGVNVWATDIDPDALFRARQARYPASALEALPRERRRHFTSLPDGRGECHEVREHVRARVAFELHDLGIPGAWTRQFDVICCRNTLIYFRPALQLRAQSSLRDRLRPGGLLCLGEAEWIHPELLRQFRVIDRRGKVFQLLHEASASE